MKKIFGVIFKIYNIFALIVGHLAILGGLIVLGYYLHKRNLLYFVLVGIILLLILVIIIINVRAKIKAKKGG